MTSLLPPSVRDERMLALEACTAGLQELPVEAVLGALYDPARAHDLALPFLAHQFGVLDEIWVLAGTTAARRGLVANALMLQARRGTVRSIRDALAAIGWGDLVLQERTSTWAHYRVSQPLGGQAVTPGRLQDLKNTLAAWAPARCILEGLTLQLTFESPVSLVRPQYDGTFQHDGTIKYEGFPADTLGWVLIGQDTPTIQIEPLTVTQSGSAITVSFTVDEATANGLTLNAYELYSQAGTLVASATAAAVAKTSDVTLQVVWKLDLNA